MPGSDSELRIAHVIVGLGIGGAETVLKRIIEHHKQNLAYRHSIISLTRIGPLGEELRLKGVSVVTLEMRSILDAPGALLRLIRLFREIKPHIVQTWMYHADLLGGLASYLSGQKNIIWGVHSIDLTKGTSSATLVRKICSLLSKIVPAKIVCASNASRRSHALSGYSTTKMLVIPNGFDVEEFKYRQDGRATLRRMCQFSDQMLVVGIVGRFSFDKDYENFVKAAAELIPNFPHVRFLMLGPEIDDENRELVGWINQTKFPERFVLLGLRLDVASCLSAMDVFCLSSRAESFPNVLGEAMAVGLPCVATDVGDTALLLGETGVVVPKEDPIALANGLRSFLSLTSMERKSAGDKSRKRIIENFSIDNTAAKHETLYRELMHRSVY